MAARARAAVRVKGRNRSGVERAAGARVGRRVVLAAARGGRIVLGPAAVVGDRCELRASPGAVIVVEGVLDERCRLVAQASITVEAGARLGSECVLVDADPAFDDPERPVVEQGWQDVGPVEIGRNSWIGMGSIVLPGVRIGEGCVVGAGSVVTRDLEDFSVAVGNPARAIRSRR